MRLTGLILSLLVSSFVFGQDNYEIQVYSSPTMEKGMTMFEFHTNYAFSGENQMIDGVLPTNHSLHETLEITHGITKNFELGFYLFTNYTDGHGYKLIGSHLRPRVSAPEDWHLPVGLSLSAEIGYQDKNYSAETWNVELRPIIDKQLGSIYLSLNPTIGIGLEPDSISHKAVFEPNFKASLQLKKVALGLEYYGNLGPFNAPVVFHEQEHALFAVADLDLDPNWEVNFGPGFGLTSNSDPFVFKLIVGRRINWNRGLQHPLISTGLP